MTDIEGPLARPSEAAPTFREPTIAWPKAARAWLTVALLFAAYTLSFVDRQLLVLLIAPIQRDLGISDVEFSLLSGLAFTFFYTLLGIPLAWVADRWSRRNLITISICAWSLMTAICGLARSFGGLFLARIGVGIGEAGLTPAAYSMIADSFPPERRGRAMATFTMGSNTGLGLALIVGGSIAQWALTTPALNLGAGLVIQGWQLAFFIVSLPGVPLAILFLFLREPARQEKGQDQVKGPSLTAFFRRRWRVFLLLCLGYTLTTVSLSVYLTWTPAFFGRSYGWNPAQVGSAFGVILILFGTAGLFAGGWFTDKLLQRGHEDAILRAVIIASCCGLPFAVAVPFAGSAWASLILLAPMVFFIAMPLGVQALSFQAITPNELRSRVLAIFLLIGNLVAFTLAPTAVAVISSHVLNRSDLIGEAMAIVSAIAAPLGILCLYAVRKQFCEAKEY